MRISRLGYFAFGASLTLLLFSGCSSVGPHNATLPSSANQASNRTNSTLSFGTAGSESWRRVLPPGIRIPQPLPAAATASFNACPANPLVFLSVPTIPEIYIFTGSENGSVLCGAILGHGLNYPLGLDLDARGQLWVANYGAPNVLVFPPPYVNVNPLVMADPGGSPVGIEADCRKHKWATNGNGTVSQIPGATFSDPLATSEFFPACDPAGDLFTTYLDASGVGHANEFPFPNYAAVVQVGLNLAYPGGLDYEDGTLLVGDQVAKSIIPCPGGTTPCGPAILLSSSGDPVSFDLNHADEDIWTADAQIPGHQEYDYPSGVLDHSYAGSPGPMIGVAFWKDDEP